MASSSHNNKKGEDNRRKDLDKGHAITVKCTIDDRKFTEKIYSCKDEGPPARQPEISYTLRGDISASVPKSAQGSHEKMRHYFYYSDEPGEGKTDLLKAVKKNCNSTTINTRTWFDPEAQFAVVDDFNISQCIPYRAMIVNGEKTIPHNGTQVVTRPDMQFIMAGNEHLFGCFTEEKISYVDKDTSRKVIPYDAALQLLYNVNIVKMNDVWDNCLQQGALYLPTDNNNYRRFTTFDFTVEDPPVNVFDEIKRKRNFVYDFRDDEEDDEEEDDEGGKMEIRYINCFIKYFADYCLTYKGLIGNLVTKPCSSMFGQSSSMDVIKKRKKLQQPKKPISVPSKRKRRRMETDEKEEVDSDAETTTGEDDDDDGEDGDDEVKLDTMGLDKFKFFNKILYCRLMNNLMRYVSWDRNRKRKYQLPDDRWCSDD